MLDTSVLKSAESFHIWGLDNRTHDNATLIVVRIDAKSNRKIEGGTCDAIVVSVMLYCQIISKAKYNTTTTTTRIMLLCMFLYHVV